MKTKQYTELDLKGLGYVYLGEYGVSNKDHPANQLWRWRDELILYDPESQEIIWRQWNEPRFQTIVEPLPHVFFGRREHK